MRGIILAGGLGTRLYPATKVISKQLLPIYDKPMIYYPLATLMLAGIKEILIISTKEDLPRFQKLLSDGSHLGINLQYAFQEKPEGIAQAFLIAKDFIQNESVALILGDNLFYGQGLSKLLQQTALEEDGCTLFGYHVKDPTRYGIVEFDQHHEVISIEEKPKTPKSNYAVSGLYFYDNDVVSLAKTLKPSLRNELEITDIHKIYLKEKKLKVHLLGRGYAWLDTGTFDSYLQASSFIQMMEQRQGIKIACIEEIAYRMGYITKEQLESLADEHPTNSYGHYLKQLTEQTLSKLLTV